MSDVTSYGFMIEELRAQQLRCAYSSKVCHNPRAIKLCGLLHKLCEFHRKKANLNQMRLQQRRRVIRVQMAAQQEHHQQKDQQARQFSTDQAVDGSLTLLFSYNVSDSEKVASHRPTEYSFGNNDDDNEFSDQDAQLLQSILFDEPQFSVYDMDIGENNENHHNNNNIKSKTAYDQQSFGTTEICL